MEIQNLKDNKICIATSFYMTDEAYSLVNVVIDQIKMLTEVGDYKIKVIVEEGMPENELIYPWNHPSVTIERIPPFHRDNNGVLPDNYEEDVNRLYEKLKEILKDVKIVISHDLILQPAELVYNLAMRKLANERNDLRFLHWAHSSTAPEIRCSNADAREIIQQQFPNSFVCYPNAGDKKRVAINYKYEMDQVKTVYHPADFLDLMFGKEINLDEIPNLSDEARQEIDKRVNYPIKLSKDFVKEFNVLNADVISCITCRLDRGKQVEWNIRIMGAIKKLGRSVKLIVVDFHSNSKDPNDDKFRYREDLKRIAREWDMELNADLIFVSEWREDTDLHVPRQFIMNLKKISDWNCHMSTSETFSLVVLESMIWRNFCMLNLHTPYLKDIYGSENVLYEPAGGAIDIYNMEDGATNIDINNEQIHFENLAKKVLYFIEVTNPVLAQWRYVRQRFSLERIFKRQLEPLFYHQDLK